MSALYAPTGPIQFSAGPPSSVGADTLNAASRGEYEISASAMSTASVTHKNPISSLSRLLSVGVRKRTELSSALGKAESCGRVHWRYRAPAWRNAKPIRIYQTNSHGEQLVSNPLYPKMLIQSSEMPRPARRRLR